MTICGQTNCCDDQLFIQQTYDVLDCTGIIRQITGNFGGQKVDRRARSSDDPFRIVRHQFYYDISQCLVVGEKIDFNGSLLTVDFVECSPIACRCCAEAVEVIFTGCLEPIQIYSKTRTPGCDGGLVNALLLEPQAVVWQHSNSNEFNLGTQAFERMYRFYPDQEFCPTDDSVIWWSDRAFRIEDVIDKDRPERRFYLLAKEIAWQPSSTGCEALSVS